MKAYEASSETMSTAPLVQTCNPGSLQVQVKSEPTEDLLDLPNGSKWCESVNNSTFDGRSPVNEKALIGSLDTEDLSNKPGTIGEGLVTSGRLKGKDFEFGQGQIVLRGEDFIVERDPDFNGEANSETETETKPKRGERSLSLSLEDTSSITDAEETLSSAQSSLGVDIQTTSPHGCVNPPLLPSFACKCSPPLDGSQESVSASSGFCQVKNRYARVRCGDKSCEKEPAKQHVHHKHSSAPCHATDDCETAWSGKGGIDQTGGMSPSRTTSDERGEREEVEMVTDQQEHERRAHKKFQCQECRRRFGWSSHLKSHLETVHRGEKNHPCPQCGKDFSLRGTLNRHLKTVHQGERRYMCFECGGNFSRKSVLDKHVDTVHQGQRKHECSLCGGNFGQKGHLERHMATVHRKEQKFPCAECVKSFGQISHLRSHVSSIHGGVKKR